MNFRSSIEDIPLPEGVFDLVLCTEVLVHVTDPIRALERICALVKRGGTILLAAPYSCGIHQAPNHYYSGFTPYWYEHFLDEFGFDVEYVEPNGGFYKMLGQENARLFWYFQDIKHLYDDETRGDLEKLFGDFLPKYLIDLDGRVENNQFTVGYHVKATRRV